MRLALDAHREKFTRAHVADQSLRLADPKHCELAALTGSPELQDKSLNSMPRMLTAAMQKRLPATTSGSSAGLLDACASTP